MSVVFTSRIPQIIGASTARASLAVHKTATDILAGTRTRSRVDTSQMRNGWQVEADDEFSATVYNSVEHSAHNEYGTRHMPAQPMLDPSVEENRDPFLKAMSQVYT